MRIHSCASDACRRIWSHCLLTCWTMFSLRKAFFLQNPQQGSGSFMCVCVPLPPLCFVPALQALQGRLCRWAAKACQSMLQSNRPSRELGCLQRSANYGNLLTPKLSWEWFIFPTLLVLKTQRMTSCFAWSLKLLDFNTVFDTKYWKLTVFSYLFFFNCKNRVGYYNFSFSTLGVTFKKNTGTQP